MGPAFFRTKRARTAAKPVDRALAPRIAKNWKNAFQGL